MAGNANRISEAVAVDRKQAPDPVVAHAVAARSGHEPCPWAQSCGLQSPDQPHGDGIEGNEALVVELAERDLEQGVLVVGSNAVVLEIAQLTNAQTRASHEQQRPGTWLARVGEAVLELAVGLCRQGSRQVLRQPPGTSRATARPQGGTAGAL